MASTRTGRMVRAGAPAAVLAAALALGAAAPAGAVHEGDYPAHIHAGSCESLGDVVFPLGNAVVGGLAMGMGADMGMMEGTPAGGETESAMAMGEEMGSEARIPVATSYTVVDAPLADILGADHAINVHLSDEEIATYVACGDLGGMVMTGAGMEGGGTLIVGLRTLNDSRISGVAMLEGMGAQTAVTLFLGENLGGLPADMGTPAA